MLEEKWVVVATAPDQLTAEMWQQELIYAQIPAMVEPADVSSFMGVSPLPCRVVVPEPLLEQARGIIGEG